MSVKWQNKDKLKFNKTDDPLFHLHEYHIDVQSNHIYLMPWDELAATDEYGASEPGVEYTMANKFIMNARACMMSNPGANLVVHMKTCGGDWNEGMSIFDMLISYPHETTIINYTHARSMSSIVFSAATKRVMMPHSYFLFHDGTYGDEGTVKQVKANWEYYQSQGPIMLEIYAVRMKQKGKFSDWPIEEIRSHLREHMDQAEDVYLTAHEAIEWGLADEVFNGDWTKLATHTEEQVRFGREFGEYFLTYDHRTLPEIERKKLKR